MKRGRIILFILIVCISHIRAQNKRPLRWAQPVNTTSIHNIHIITGKVFRSEEPEQDQFVELKELGIITIVSLCTDYIDRTYFNNLGLKVYQVPIRARSFDNQEIIAALKVLNDAPKPMLIYCKQGTDWTGVVIAMYRVLFESWCKEDAIMEMETGGYNYEGKNNNISNYIKEADVDFLKQEIGID